MKIEYSLYELPFLHPSEQRSRHGALLKFLFNENHIGYADCHPWEELGDLPLQKQLELLKRGITTPLTANAIICANIDADARFEKRALLDFSIRLKSHYLILNIHSFTIEEAKQAFSRGFTHFKVKLGKKIDHEVTSLVAMAKRVDGIFRLDFNEKISSEQFKHVLYSLSQIKERIDFIEDPCPFQAGTWKEFQDDGWMLGCDREVLQAQGKKASSSVLIIKPAVDPEQLWAPRGSQRWVVTSYLGHPLGQVFAAYIAAQNLPLSQEVHGLLSHQVYLPNAFSIQISGRGPYFIVPSGTGFGFDELLEQMEWRLL